MNYRAFLQRRLAHWLEATERLDAALDEERCRVAEDGFDEEIDDEFYLALDEAWHYRTLLENALLGYE